MNDGAEILVTHTPGRTRTALIGPDGTPRAFLVDTDTRARPGAIHAGRVDKVTPLRLFVALATGEVGVLPRGKGDKGVTEGQALIVQVKQSAPPGKGPELTTDVALRGTLCVFTPRHPGIAVSKSVQGKETRNALHEAATRASGDGEGWVVRTAAVDASAVTLAAEMVRLRARWESYLKCAHDCALPAVLDPGPPAAATLADGVALTGILCDSEAAFKETREAANHLIDKVCLYGRDEPLFERQETEDVFEAALAPVVSLPSGGRLTIEPTRALIAVDVDSGPADAAVTNLEAAAELARQMRLRNLSGQILLDLIPTTKANRAAALEALSAALADDPVHTVVHGPTRLGLIEITRPRFWPALHEVYTAGAETVALNLLAEAVRIKGTMPVTARCHPSVAGLLSGPLSAARDETTARLKRPLTVKADPKLTSDAYKLEE